MPYKIVSQLIMCFFLFFAVGRGFCVYRNYITGID